MRPRHSFRSSLSSARHSSSSAVEDCRRNSGKRHGSLFSVVSAPTAGESGEPRSSARRTSDKRVISRSPSDFSTGIFSMYAESRGHSYLDNVIMEEFEGAAGLEGESREDEEYSMGMSRSVSHGWRAKVKAVVRTSLFSVTFLILSFYALLAPDLDVAYGNLQSQYCIQRSMTVVVMLFSLEIMSQSFASRRYCYGASFWLDLIALLSLVFDTHWFQDALHQRNLAASQSSKIDRVLGVSSDPLRAGRLNRLGKIARAAAFLPRLQRLLGSSARDSATEQLMEKKLFRLFQFMDEDLDGMISQHSAMHCIAKMRKQIIPGHHGWTNKMAMQAGGVAHRVVDNALVLQERIHSVLSRSSTNSVRVWPSDGSMSPVTPTGSRFRFSGSRSSERSSARMSSSRSFISKMMTATVTYEEFCGCLHEDHVLAAGIRRACEEQLKQGYNMQTTTTRNAAHVSEKVVASVLCLLVVFFLLQSCESDSSAASGLQMVDGIVRWHFPNHTEGQTMPEILKQQVALLSSHHESEHGVFPRLLRPGRRPDRSGGWAYFPSHRFLYLDIDQQVICGERKTSAKQRCVADELQGVSWGPRRRSLTDLDVMSKTLHMRWEDYVWVRYPDPSIRDEAASPHELNEFVRSVALLDQEVENRSAGLESVCSSCLVILIIAAGIGMFTRDLTMLSESLLRPLMELVDDVESITRLQISAFSEEDSSEVDSQAGIVEVRLMRQTFQNMKKAIKSWGKYVPWPVVQILLRNDVEANLEVAECEVTVFHSDIAQFTSIVESLPSEQSLLLLSRYFHDMSKIIDDYGGIVLEFIGDAIMSIFGAPVSNVDHATSAVKSAVTMLAALKIMNSWFVLHGLPQVSIRCGVHTGTVLVGNVGFQTRMKYGIIGQGSAIPSRLEELNKSYATELLISHDTYGKLNHDAFLIRPIDYVRLQGAMEDAQLIYEVVRRDERLSWTEGVQYAFELHGDAILHYRECSFARAHDKFAEASALLEDLTGNYDVASNLMCQRCQILLRSPPPVDWDGSWIFDQIKL